MRDGRILKTQHGQYAMAAWDGENRSGYVPLGDAVLVLMDAPMSTTKGGIHLAADTEERQELAAVTGVVVAIGPSAFVWTADRTAEYQGQKPVPGDRVVIEKYAGQFTIGHDGRKYRLLRDASIGALEIAPAADAA